jgi:hypothetical protein
MEVCPKCESTEIRGPSNDYWGYCCVNCGYEQRLYEDIPIEYEDSGE